MSALTVATAALFFLEYSPLRWQAELARRFESPKLEFPHNFVSLICSKCSAANMIASSMRFCCLAYGLLLLRWQHFGPFSVLDWKNVMCLWSKTALSMYYWLPMPCKMFTSSVDMRKRECKQKKGSTNNCDEYKGDRVKRTTAR